MDLKPPAVDVLHELICTNTNQYIRENYASSAICGNCGELGEKGDSECSGCGSSNMVDVNDAVDLFFML